MQWDIRLHRFASCSFWLPTGFVLRVCGRITAKGATVCSIARKHPRLPCVYPACPFCSGQGCTEEPLSASAQFSCSVGSDSLRPHKPQHARPPCLLPTPGVYSISCPLSRGCHPTTSSSVIPFSSCLQSFPASGSFPMSQLFTSGSQSIGVSASTSVLPMNIQD